MRRTYFYTSLLTLATWCALGVCPPAAANDARIWSQGEAPPLQLKDLQGKVRTLEEFRGKVVVINFWATWCEPCVEELPALQKLRDRLAGRPFVLLGVNLGENAARIETFMEKTALSFPVLRDPDGDAKRDWKVNGVPATYVVDPQGRIRFYYVGEVDFNDASVETKIKQLLPDK